MREGAVGFLGTGAPPWPNAVNPDERGVITELWQCRIVHDIVLSTQKRRQNVAENVMKAASVFAIGSEAVGMCLVQRVGNKSSRASCENFLSQESFCESSKPTPFSFP